MSISVVYWSGTGNTQAMAEAIGEGIESAGAQANVISVDQASVDALAGEDVFALGCSAMGAEELEESEMEPFVAELEGKVSGKNYVDIGGDMSIIDTIKYEGVQYGMTHTIKTYLVDKSTGKTVKDDNGNDIVKTTEWEPEATQGSIDIEIPVTGKKLAGRTLVVFEEIYLGDAMIACHKDINLNFPK